jgi:hypothetical protein
MLASLTFQVPGIKMHCDLASGEKKAEKAIVRDVFTFLLLGRLRLILIKGFIYKHE